MANARSLTNIALTAAYTIIGAVIIMVLLDELAPTFFASLTGFLTTLGGVTTGNTLADALIEVGIIILAAGIPLFFIGMAIESFQGKKTT